MSTLIAGLGNVLMGDDAIGPTLIHHLQARYEFPEGIELQDLGTPGVDLARHLAGHETVVVLDAIAAPEQPPGTVRRLGKDELEAFSGVWRTDGHAPDWSESLRLSALYGTPPDRVMLIGVVVGSCVYRGAAIRRVAATVRGDPAAGGGGAE
ncbi:MAG: hydrogenase maturation protease [Paludibaculum sp.]